MMSIGVADSVIRRSEFSGAITSLVADITQAKQIAARDNRYVAVIFNTDSRSYTLRVQENITSTTSWRDLRTVRALGGKVFFDSSSSTVKNFFAKVPPEVLKEGGVKLACIGPITAATLAEYGFTPDVNAAAYTVPALAQAVIDDAGRDT